MAKAADLSKFQVNTTKPRQKAETAPEKERPLKLKGFYISPEAELQFDILKRKSGKRGPELIQEALNLLFKEYGLAPTN